MNFSQTFIGWGPIDWKEEVLLHDNSTIIVRRTQTHGGRGEIGSSPLNSQTISFRIPKLKDEITWEDRTTNDIGGVNFLPLALHLFNDTTYLIVEPQGCLSYNKWGRPNPPYVIFRNNKEGWERIDQKALPDIFRNINLTINTRAHEDRLVGFDVVSYNQVKMHNSTLRQGYLKEIIREPLTGDSIGIDCKKMIPARDHIWLSIDWFSDKESLDDCLKLCKNKGVQSQACPCDSIF